MTGRGGEDRFDRLAREALDRGLDAGALADLLRTADTDHLGFARVDLGRGARQSLPEVILGRGKASGDIVAIFGSLLERTGHAMATRLGEEAARELTDSFPGSRICERCLAVAAGAPADPVGHHGPVSVVTAGTSDLGPASEADFILREMGARSILLADVGVAGIHRLSTVMGDISGSAVCIVFAGMDGALPSVIGGLFPGPVIAVPTSQGYGTSFGGVSAMLAMLNSCSPGVAVMNVDNGLGAAAAALRILGMLAARADGRGVGG